MVVDVLTSTQSNVSKRSIYNGFLNFTEWYFAIHCKVHFTPPRVFLIANEANVKKLIKVLKIHGKCTIPYAHEKALTVLGL